MCSLRIRINFESFQVVAPRVPWIPELAAFATDNPEAEPEPEPELHFLS